jgi:hypothetical protein
MKENSIDWILCNKIKIVPNRFEYADMILYPREYADWSLLESVLKRLNIEPDKGFIKRGGTYVEGYKCRLIDLILKHQQIPEFLKEIRSLSYFNEIFAMVNIPGIQ